MVAVLSSDYIRTARAKGLSPREIILYITTAITANQ
jgi:peptide/nickel transport system permease protein